MNRHNIKVSVLLTVASVMVLISCDSSLVLSDNAAVELLKSYYSFYEEKAIDATIISRGNFMRDCKCYPIEFQITYSNNGNKERTFYFYKNTAGTLEIRKFKFGVKHS